MIWLTWRQERAAGFVTLGVIALAGLFLLITGLNMAHDFQQSGLSACLAQYPDSTSGGPCGSLATIFLNQYTPYIPFASALLILPILLGAIVGAPLLAREYEQRTHQLVWMQSISRTRWLIVKLAVLFGVVLLASGALLAVLIWWYNPFDQLFGKFNPVAFDYSGPVFIAASAMALAVGICAGTLTRRTVLAIFLTLALLVAIRIVVEFNLRYNYQPQIVVTWSFDKGPSPPVTLGKEDWNTGSGFLDPQGNRTNSIYCNISQPATPIQCAKAAGYRGYYFAYQPASRFWTFQWIETGIYLAVTAVALVATALLVRRRIN
jgi:ABC-type transport system involved in multi-copper enzyme maturation permease subunit